MITFPVNSIINSKTICSYVLAGTYASLGWSDVAIGTVISIERAIFYASARACN